MIARERMLVIGVLAVALSTMTAGRSLAQVFDAGESVAAKAIENLSQRLEALNTGNPRAYLELGEEVMSEAGNAGDRDLARRLFVLCFELERAKPPEAADRGLMSSCCLALVPLADTDGDRRWLAALGAAVGGAPASPGAIQPSLAPSIPADQALDAATVLSLARSGQGSKALRLLDRPGVTAALEKHERLLSAGLMGGGLSSVRAMIDQWPTCNHCRARRYVKDGAGVRLCPRCSGRPGPRLSNDQLVLFLRTEAALLSGVQRSWAASSLVDGGAPVRDADPAELASTLGVDVSRPLFKDGKWRAAPASPSKKATSSKDESEKATRHAESDTPQVRERTRPE